MTKLSLIEPEVSENPPAGQPGSKQPKQSPVHSFVSLLSLFIWHPRGAICHFGRQPIFAWEKGVISEAQRCLSSPVAALGMLSTAEWVLPRTCELCSERHKGGSQLPRVNMDSGICPDTLLTLSAWDLALFSARENQGRGENPLSSHRACGSAKDKDAAKRARYPSPYFH